MVTKRPSDQTGSPHQTIQKRQKTSNQRTQLLAVTDISSGKQLQQLLSFSQDSRNSIQCMIFPKCFQIF